VLEIDRTERGDAVVIQQADTEGRSGSGYLGDGDVKSKKARVCAVSQLPGLIARGCDELYK
jgi:hypothetical protein